MQNVGDNKNMTCLSEERTIELYSIGTWSSSHVDIQVHQ